MNARKRLRELIARKGCTVVPGPYELLAAPPAQVAGFDAVYLTGGGYSRSNGYPDIGLITQTEPTQWSPRTVDAVDTRLYADMVIIARSDARAVDSRRLRELETKYLKDV